MTSNGAGDAADGDAVGDGSVERRRPDWWALEPAVSRADRQAMRVGFRSRVTNHYTVEITGDVNHLPHKASDELGLRVEHLLADVVDDYELVHSETEELEPIYEDTLAGRRLLTQ